MAAGLFLRAVDLADRPLDVDEAESAINALTILERGYPGDRYMGLPIYENTLSVPWPESEEYEFRDSSYSRQGVAVYHAWLPLYAIAAALKLAGIEPDPPTDQLKPRHPPEELRLRTLVPRLPSLFFSAVFMLVLFGFGRALAGPACGWTALAFAAFTPVAVELGTPARYYSATLATSALAGWMLWRLIERGRRRDGLALGVAMTLLFHCHVLSCFVLGVLALACLPLLLRRHGFLRWGLPCGASFLVGTLPWILATGFPGEAGTIPAAWTVMELPGDLLRSSGQSPLQLLALSLAMIGVLAALACRRRLPEWLVRPVQAHSGALLLCMGWGVAAFLAFSFLIPLVSYFPARMAMMLATPKLLFVASLVVAIQRAWWPRGGNWGAPAMAGLLLLVSGRVADARKEHDIFRSHLPILAEYFATREFEAGARLYTEPNQQLVLAYALGLPAQSIAPVRRSFLDSHPGEIVFVRFPGFALLWNAERVQELLKQATEQGDWTGAAPDPAAAAAIAEAVRTEQVRTEIAAAGAILSAPPPVEVPEPVAAARAAELAMPPVGWWTGVPVFNGFDVRDHGFAWKVFFYRFVDPVARSGSSANYAGRLEGATAEILSAAAAVVYRAPLHARGPASR